MIIKVKAEQDPNTTPIERIKEIGNLIDFENKVVRVPLGVTEKELIDSLNYQIVNNMKTVFKVGDKVYDARYGWGEVTDISFSTKYPIEVAFDKCNGYNDYYTYAGLDNDLDSLTPLLSFTEYTLQGFSQERAELLPERGQIVWVRDSENSDWICAQFMRKEKGVYITTAIDPFNDENGICYNLLTTENPYINK
jgi:hypothetical protein